MTDSLTLNRSLRAAFFMPNDDISSLSAKIDMLIRKVGEQDQKLNALQRAFDASKGALGLVKTMAWLAGIVAAIWVAMKTGAR